jgi:multiple sugar transport system substrate-binding protein
MKRSLAIGTALVASVAVALTGCSSSSGGSSAEGDLTWAMWISGQEDQAAWQQVADVVTAEHPDLSVRIQGAPWTDYWTKIGTQLSSNNAPCIVSMQSLRVANYADALLPLDDLVADAGIDVADFDPAALDGLTVDGKLYAVPYDTGPIMLFYNKDLFAANGVAEPKPGWSVADFEAAGEKLKAAGSYLFAPTVEDLFLEPQLLAYNGGRIVNADGSVDIENRKFAEGLDWVASLVERGYAPDVSGADSSADDNAFINGQAASYIDGAFSILAQKAKVDFELGVTTLPAGAEPTTFSAGSGFGIAKQCAQPENALNAISTMTGEKVLTDLASAGRAYPARTATQPAWVENAGIAGVDETLAVAQAGAVPFPSSPNSELINQLLAQYAIQAINGQLSGSDVLGQIASQLPQ